MLRRIALFLIVVAMLSPVASSASFTDRVDVPITGAPSIGNTNAEVTVVEFIDYQ